VPGRARLAPGGDLTLERRREKETAMRISVIWRHMLGYLMICLFTLAYALVIDIRFGLTFLLILTVAPLALNIFNVFALRSLRLETSVSARALRKGDALRLTLRVAVAAPAFVFLRIGFHSPPNFKADEDKKLALLPWPGAALTAERLYTAVIWGAVSLGVSEVEGTDFFGLCRYAWGEGGEGAPAAWAAEIEIVPRLPDLRENELLRAVLTARPEDDEEESGRETVSYTGLPGFEHREYQPGDQLRRVNWKLSARAGVYMVRLNEPADRPKAALILDRTAPAFSDRPEENLEMFKRNERLVEAMLGMALLFVRAGLNCVVYVFLAGRWQRLVPATEADVGALQYQMARFRFAHGLAGDWGPPLPARENGDGPALLFSNRPEVAPDADTMLLTARMRAQAGDWLITPELDFVSGGV
jgi:uncharacterized protein (DUF58 family)